MQPTHAAGGSMIPGVSSTDAERARAAALALEQRGEPATVRALRSAGSLSQRAACADAAALRDGTVPPASAGPWTADPWAAAQDAQRRADDARDLRSALRSFLELVVDEHLPELCSAMHEAGLDMHRAARAYGLDPATDFDEGGLPAALPGGRVPTVGWFLKALDVLRDAPGAERGRAGEAAHVQDLLDIARGGAT